MVTSWHINSPQIFFSSKIPRFFPVLIALGEDQKEGGTYQKQNNNKKRTMEKDRYKDYFRENSGQVSVIFIEGICSTVRHTFHFLLERDTYRGVVSPNMTVTCL